VFSVLVVLMIICHRKVLFWSCLFGVLEASYTWMGISFMRFGKFPAIILFNILHIPLVCISSSQCPCFTGLVFWLSCWDLVYSFCSFWVFCLRDFLFFL
jgi:hypothetical protein